MNNSQVSEQAHDLQLRIEQMTHLGALHATGGFEGRPDGPLEDFLDSMLSEWNHPSTARLKEIFSHETDPEEDEDYEDRRYRESADLEENAHAMFRAGLLGFAVEFATPVRSYFSESSCSFSWGYYNTTWVYAESFEEAWKLGVEWAEQRAESALNEWKAKQEGKEC